MTPLQAVTQPDPYVYYAQLRRENGLVFDPALGMWIASSAQAVEAVLAHPDCHVRPAQEPVPSVLIQRATGAVFARLMRMNEGLAHRCPRATIEPALASVLAQDVAEAVTRVDAPAEDLNAFMFTLPVSVIALLLGFSEARLPVIAGLTRDFVACLSPLSSELHLQHADTGAAELLSCSTRC